MDSLITDTLNFLREESLTRRTLLATPDEFDAFTPRQKQPPAEKKQIDRMPEMRALVSKILPEIGLASTIPDDTLAKKKGQLWKEHDLTAKVLILSFAETGPALQFLHSVAKAIDKLLVPARLIEMRRIEREKGWEMMLDSSTLQLVLAPPFQEWKNISLARHYRENPTSQTFLLKETPILFLHPVASYLKNPDLKRELWNKITSQLSTSTSR